MNSYIPAAGNILPDEKLIILHENSTAFGKHAAHPAKSLHWFNYFPAHTFNKHKPI
jgi:hypothetical protein